MVKRRTKVKRIVSSTGFVVYQDCEPGRRWDWLNKMIHIHGFTLGAEIGCHRGKTTEKLLSRNPKLKMFAVDLWDIPPESSGQYDNCNFGRAKREFYRRTSKFKHRVTVLQGVSWEMASKVQDCSLDFVFIDADHSYQSVIKDIVAWTPKLKANGIISGHDTHFPTVMAAVKELIPAYQVAGIDHCWYGSKDNVLL